MMASYNLAWRFYEHARQTPEAVALVVDGVQHTYAALAHRAAAIASWLRTHPTSAGEQQRVGILADRSLHGYLGLLGACWAGSTYVPFNPRLPPERFAQQLRAASLDVAIADASGARMLEAVAPNERPLAILASDGSTGGVGSAVGLDAVPPLVAPAEVAPDAIAYLLFTSGTTGTPKGVMVTASNVAHFLAAMRDWYDFRPADRFVQYSELAFDMSVFDLFSAWDAGASTYVVPPAQYLSPTRFARENELTVWFSVPSVIGLMARTRQLAPRSLPSLRRSLFAGDAMPLALAQAWRAAAPHSTFDVHYGPTETTVICTGERMAEPPNVTRERGILSIGRPYRGTLAALVAPDLSFLEGPGQVGELALAGEQVMAGYFRDPELTARRSPVLEHPTHGKRRWYLSGDLARRDEGGAFHHLGRTDNQVKVQGYRVELEDLDTHLRAVSGTEAVASVGWPVVDGTAAALVAFVSGAAVGVEAIQAALRARLPPYMVPRRVLVLEALPLNANGKIDRHQLRAGLASGRWDPGSAQS